MAGRFARLPRLTLFSGPHCSLCDIAKAELAKVRKVRAFELETVNIQDPGQERWKRKRKRSGEGSLGRGDSTTGSGQMAADPRKSSRTDGWGDTEPIVALPPFVFVDPSPEAGWSPYISCEYDSLSNYTSHTLGEEPRQEHHVRRCFNCGSEYHQLSDCPEPRNHSLISLSRQLFNFLNPSVPLRRIHEVEEWKRQRLKWLESFEPGRIQGPLLREALGLEEDDIGQHQLWLSRMADWGYPRGWVGNEDPRLTVCRIILEEDDPEDEPEDQVFTVHGEQEEPEKLDLTLQTSIASYREPSGGQSGSPFPGPDLEKSAVSTTANSDTTEAIDVTLVSSLLRRWATYPGTYFSSSLLPVYNGSRLPAIVPVHELSSTFTEDRQRLWEKILSGTTVAPTTGQSSVPPWRIPNVFSSPDWAVGFSSPDAPPPPPSIAPPPLPPSPPLPFVSSHSESSSSTHDITKTAVNLDPEPTAAQLLFVGDLDPSDETDMDISDSE